MQRRQLSIEAAVVLTVAIALSACGINARRLTAEHLSIGFLQDPLASLFYVADAKGIFARHGLAVSFRFYEGGAYAIRDMEEGSIDMAAATEYALVRQSFQVKDLRSLATLATANNSELLVLADRGIKTPRDLRGKRIGVTVAMNTRYILGAFLAFNGLRFDEVEAVDLAPSQIVADLENGSIDAGCIYPPFTTGAKADLGTALVAWPTQGLQDYYYLLVARAEFIKEKPRVVNAMLSSLLDAEAFFRNHDDECRQIVGKALGLSSVEVAGRLAGIRMRVSLGEDLLALMEDEARWIVSVGSERAEDLPNSFLLLHYQPLEQLKHEAVSVIH